MNKCPKCGTEFEGKFCPECGTRWLKERICPSCGKSLPGSAKFCTYCGKSFYTTLSPAPQPKKTNAFKRWIGKHKKLFGFSVAGFVLVLTLAIVLPVCLVSRHNGTYYLYEGGSYNYQKYYILKGNSYTDEEGYSCDVKFDGDRIYLYGELFGVKDVFASGTIKDDVIKLDIMGAEMVYAKQGHVHKFEQQTVIEPTCEQEGVTAERCYCGFQKNITAALSPLGHDFRNNVCVRCGMEASVGLTYDFINGSYTVTGIGECEDTVLVIPTTHEGRPVTSIGEKAFSDCNELQTVIIPNSMTSIGNYAFLSCRGLQSVTIGRGVTSIGDSAFDGCDRFEKFIIVTGNMAYSSQDGVLYNKKQTQIIFVPKAIKGAVAIPGGVTEIEDRAFYDCSGLTEITIGGGVTSIGAFAFEGCNGLTEITIPNSVTSIGQSAFAVCSELTKITIPDSVTSIGNYAFFRCGRLTGELKIPGNATSIGEYAFSACSGLTGVLKIPDSVTSIGAFAFEGCRGLTEITIPNSLSSIGKYAFVACGGLQSITVAARNKVYKSEQNCLIEIETNTLLLGCNSSVIPESVTSIANNAFEGCSGLTEIKIPDNITSIGDMAFYGCSGLTAITIPDSVTQIGGQAFCHCSGLTEIKILDSVISIGEFAFHDTAYYNDDSHWTDDVLYIDGWLIKARNTISEDYSIRNGTKMIANYAFSGCSGLTSITIPDSVTNIGDGAFYECSGLTEITIGGSVTAFGYDVFYDCKELTSIKFNGTTEAWKAIKKGSFWRNDSPIQEVVCTNGTLTDTDIG